MSALRAVDVLYYTTKSLNEEGALVTNSNELTPEFYEDAPSGYNGGISSRRMTDHKFDQYNDNNYYLVYEGFRIPAPVDAKDYQLGLAIYKEDLNIQTPAGSLHASCIYPDTGSTFDTAVSFTEFVVNGATGKFSGVKQILIEYSNDGTAPWARDGNNKPVKSARRMTLMGDVDASTSNALYQRRVSNLRKMVI